MEIKTEDSKLASIQLDDDAQISSASNLPDEQNQNYIRLFSSLFMDQINVQDVNAVLESQKQMLAFKIFY